jgi:putative membrane protein
VGTDTVLIKSINKAKRHYSSLFVLPSTKISIVALACVCITAGLLSAYLFNSFQGLAIGLLLGGALFGVTFVVDLILIRLVLNDRIFITRRMLGLSLASWAFWIVFLTIGALLSLFYDGELWVKFCLLGFATLLTLRTIVFLTVSSTPSLNRYVAVLLPPYACIIIFAFFWIYQGMTIINYIPYLLLAPLIAVGCAYLFVHLLDRIGQKSYNVPSMKIFRAFILNWVSGENDPLEQYLENIGKDSDVEVSMLKFDGGKPKAAFVLPLVHPGPFKNIGSSILPSLLKEEYDLKFSCDSCVPLGLLGHELDAASQQQNHKIINQVLTSATFEAFDNKASPHVTVSEGGVSTSCQIFGKTAFLSYTLAPKTTEDLPQELGGLVQKEARKLGLDAVLVNAHNSLTENTEIEASLEMLTNVAVKCLQKAAGESQFSFKVGSSTVHPAEFSVKAGMGAGGITAIVVKVADQKTAYVVVDGNNMQSGLREKILAILGSVGFEASEIFTTDTHAVSGVIVGPRGYHPVGEAMDHQKLIAEITKVTSAAAANLESCKAGYRKFIVPQVRVIGGGALGFMTLLVDKTIKKAKQILLPVFGLEGLLLVLLLFL